jgi:hypothetical protein
MGIEAITAPPIMKISAVTAYMDGCAIVWFYDAATMFACYHIPDFHIHLNSGRSVGSACCQFENLHWNRLAMNDLRKR